MTACYLSRYLHDVRITLIESAKTPRIGVGEATVPALTKFMSRVGFPTLRSWLPECDGTIKTGILFQNWLHRGDRYWHPFEALDYLDDRHHIGHWWLHARQQEGSPYGERISFYRSFFPSMEVNLERFLAPINTSFAYHLNADLFGDLLRRASLHVRHVIDDVLEVQLAESGEIQHLKTAANGEIKADLYIDCTGFRRMLIRAVAPRQHFQSYANSLFCDRAIVLRFPYLSDESKTQEMAPYVRARAESSGWTWTIPLYSRISSGYVYSSAFQTAGEAEAELRSLWGEDRVKDASMLPVKFESGKLDSLWVKNCVAIGLAGSFIEPLESTGLAITQMGIEMLASVLDARFYNDFIQSRYNTHAQKFCDDIMHFIVAHYCFTTREDTPFWRHVKYETVIPDELKERLNVFRRLLPTITTKGMEELWFFRDVSWFAVLLGMNFPFDPPSMTMTNIQRGREILEQKRTTAEKYIVTRPPHAAFLRDHVYSQRQWFQAASV